MWDFNGSSENERVLKPLCRQVDQLIGLPPKRIYRYFATFEDSALFEAHPLARGFHLEFDREKVKELPLYLRDCFSLTPEEMGKVAIDAPLEDLVAFDDLIYLRCNTCLDSTGCVVTYAHELHHVVQNHRHPILVKANSLLREKLPDVKPDATERDLPMEVEANIVSKHTAELVCGEASVQAFAERQVFLTKTGHLGSQAKRWKYFLELVSTTPYDFVDATLRLVETYKTRIEFGFDVDGPDWWKDKT
jgi:hypothetical protein